MSRKKYIARKNLRRIIINENIKIYEDRMLSEQKKFKSRMIMLNKIKRSQLHLKEQAGFMDSLLGMGKDYLGDMLGAGKESIKGYIIGKVISMFGVEEGTEAYDAITSALEEIEIGQLTGLVSGKTELEDVMEKIVKGLVEYLVEKGMEEIQKYIQDIPLLNKAIPDKDTLLGSISSEKMADDIASVVTPKIMPVLKDATDTIKSGIAGGGDKLQAMASLQEIYLGAAKHSRSKILSYDRKLRTLKSIKI